MTEEERAQARRVAVADVRVAIEQAILARGLTFAEVVDVLADALQSHAKSARKRQRPRKEEP